MKALTNLIIICMAVSLVLGGCSKEDTAPTSSTLTYINNASTPITLALGSQSQTLAPKGKLVLTGKPGVAANGTASTSGVTTSGDQVGNLMTWSIDDTYPSSGNLTVNLNVSTDFFFLQITNQSSYTISKVYVNYKLLSQTVDNISIPADGKTYSIGYYKAFANSNVRAEATGGSFTGNITLPNTLNQVYTFTAVN